MGNITSGGISRGKTDFNLNKLWQGKHSAQYNTKIISFRGILVTLRCLFITMAS